jgi:sugar phosphate isomerase/epimerase
MFKYSLAFLTIPDVSPTKAIEIAQKAGFQGAGLRILPAVRDEDDYPLLTDPQTLRDVATALEDNAITVGDLELIRIRKDFQADDYSRFFEVAQFLGVQNVVVLNDDTDLSRATDSFARLCEYARPYDLWMNLEPIPWTALHDLRDAKDILRNARQPNAAILIDAFHFYRRHTALATLEDIPESWLRLFQICDAPKAFDSDVDSIRREARTARLFPGEGDLDLSALLRALPSDISVSVEVPNATYLSQYTPVERASLALQSARQALIKAGMESSE